jgi:hypothetical protein
MMAPDGIRNRSGWLTLSRGNPTGPAQADKTSVGRTPQTGLVGKLVCPTLIRERSAKVGLPGRSVAASASALGAEDRRFESCRPDTVIQSTALAPEDHHDNAGVAQWQSPSLPSWPCEFDSRHPLQSTGPSQHAFTAPKLFEHGDDKNNQAGHLFFMIIGARPPYAPCQAGFHELGIGWSQS